MSHHHVTSAYFVSFSTSSIRSYPVLSHFVRVGIPFSSCNPLNQGHLLHKTTPPWMIASAPRSGLAIAFVTSTPHNDWQHMHKYDQRRCFCSTSAILFVFVVKGCTYGTAKMPRSHEQGDLKPIWQVKRGKWNVPHWIIRTEESWSWLRHRK